MQPTISTEDDFRTDVEKTKAQLPKSAASDSDDALIEKLCHHFEQDWRNGPQPRLDEYVNEFKAAGQDRLFARLLEIELDYRVASGELPSAAAYCERLPQYAEAIERCFAARHVEPYFLGGKLGEGGMGAVYKAIHVELERVTALKLILGKGDPARFKKEMKALGPLSHSNIVRAEHAGGSDRGLFLAMELIEGVNLADLVKRHGPLPASTACELARQVATGLDYIHKHDLVHRDIKPQNLMLDSTGVVKILDLGLARCCENDDTSRTDTGTVFGTVDFMPPEQFANSKDVDIRGDVYSLGCTLYYLLSGKPPFPSPEYQGYVSKMYAHVNVPPRDIRDSHADVPPQLVEILARALAKSRDDRYQTPGEFGAALAPLASADGLAGLTQSKHDAKPAAASPSKTVTATEAAGSRETHRTKPSAQGPSVLRSRMSRRTLVGAAVGLVFIGLAATFAFTGGDGRKPPLPATLRRSLATQQGPSGVWWFDEIPQFNPILRRRILSGPEKKAREIQAAMATQDDAGIVTSLHDFAKSLQQSNPSEESQGLITICFNSSDDDDESRNKSLRRLDVIRSVLIGLKPELAAPRTDAKSDIAPEYLHFFAVITHKIASLDQGNSAELFEEAAVNYQQAIANYLAADELDLMSLCRADLARCAVDQGDETTGASLYESAESTTESPDRLFNLYTLCCKAESYYQSQQRSEARLAIEAADRLLTADVPAALQALVREQSGWLHMECWAAERNPIIREQELADADADFAKAEAIRNNLRSSDVSLTKWFHNRHGRALVDQYAGRSADSIRAYESLVSELQEAVNDRKYPTHTHLMLHTRLLNSRERMAECYLYGPTPNFERAIEIYRQATADGVYYLIGAGMERPAVAQILCKQSISEALTGQKAAARKSLASATKQCNDLLTEQRDDKQLLLDVADALSGPLSDEQTAAAVQTRVTTYLNSHGAGLSRDQTQVLELVYTQLKLDVDQLHR